MNLQKWLFEKLDTDSMMKEKLLKVWAKNTQTGEVKYCTGSWISLLSQEKKFQWTEINWASEINSLLKDWDGEKSLAKDLKKQLEQKYWIVSKYRTELNDVDSDDLFWNWWKSEQKIVLQDVMKSLLYWNKWDYEKFKDYLINVKNLWLEEYKRKIIWLQEINWYYSMMDYSYEKETKQLHNTEKELNIKEFDLLNEIESLQLISQIIKEAENNYNKNQNDKYLERLKTMQSIKEDIERTKSIIERSNNNINEYNLFLKQKDFWKEWNFEKLNQIFQMELKNFKGSQKDAVRRYINYMQRLERFKKQEIDEIPWLDFALVNILAYGPLTKNKRNKIKDDFLNKYWVKWIWLINSLNNILTDVSYISKIKRYWYFVNMKRDWEEIKGNIFEEKEEAIKFVKEFIKNHKEDSVGVMIEKRDITNDGNMSWFWGDPVYIWFNVSYILDPKVQEERDYTHFKTYWINIKSDVINYSDIDYDNKKIVRWDDSESEKSIYLWIRLPFCSKGYFVRTSYKEKDFFDLNTKEDFEKFINSFKDLSKDHKNISFDDSLKDCEIEIL